MVSQSTIFRATVQQDVMNEMRNFIAGATKTVKCNPLDLTKTALSLLKTLPASRDAVLEYFCSVFEKAAENYIVAIETEIATGQLPRACEYDEVILTEIHTVLCSFVAGNPEAWAPIISTWSLELLGEISTKYQGRAHISTGLNETLQLWMNCRATRTLIDITTQCLSCLIHSNTEACISALLDTSVKHSPNFDWVVAHVGSCFPNTVITRVLSCGLKDFCQNKSYEQGCDSPKLKSVVGILGHLAGSHCDDIRRALLDLFNWSLTSTSFQDGEPVKSQKKATVPFLLQLSNLSSTLLSTVCSNLQQTIPIDVILQLYNFTDDWCKYFGSPEALKDLLVNLILKCEKGGSQIINLLLDCIFLECNHAADETMKHTIQVNGRDVLEFVLQEIDFSIRHQSSRNVPINILNSLIFELDDIHEMLLCTETIKFQTAARIIIFIGHNNPSLLIKSAKYLFESAKTDNHLALMARILTDELIDKTVQPYANKGGYFSAVLEQVLSEYLHEISPYNDRQIDDDKSVQMWSNLLTLLKWEKSNKVQILKSQIVTRALQFNLITFTTIFSRNKLNKTILHTVTEILEILNIPTYNEGRSYIPPLQVILNFTNGIVNYFFVCCKETDEAVRLKGCERTVEILKRLCIHSNIARILALRELIERSLFSSCNVLFGAKEKPSAMHDHADKLLLKQNKKLSKTIPLTKHSSVYNGGIIGSGKRKSVSFSTLGAGNIASNVEQLIHVIKACCALPMDSVKQSDVSQDSIIQVSLLLVQYVSPDVMYNGLPWPEEEFSKVTIERDLFIRRLFGNTPLLWDLLSLVAVYRPALCYCSVIIRALTATLMHQWSSMGDQSKSTGTHSYKSLMDTTIKVIDIMALGQLLPPPLSGIRDVIIYFNSFEIVAILRDCIWSYIRDHIPSPALFVCDSNNLYWRDPTISRPPDVYTNTLRIIMQKNIKTVGHLYAQMFIYIPKND